MGYRGFIGRYWKIFWIHNRLIVFTGKAIHFGSLDRYDTAQALSNSGARRTQMRRVDLKWNKNPLTQSENEEIFGNLQMKTFMKWICLLCKENAIRNFLVEPRSAESMHLPSTSTPMSQSRFGASSPMLSRRLLGHNQTTTLTTLSIDFVLLSQHFVSQMAKVSRTEDTCDTSKQAALPEPWAVRTLLSEFDSFEATCIWRGFCRGLSKLSKFKLLLLIPKALDQRYAM